MLTLTAYRSKYLFPEFKESLRLLCRKKPVTKVLKGGQYIFSFSFILHQGNQFIKKCHVLTYRNGLTGCLELFRQSPVKGCLHTVGIQRQIDLR